MAAELCDTDAEISAELLDCIDLRNHEPAEGISIIDSAGDFLRRGAGNQSKHILAYYRKENTSEIQKRIWSAQLQVLFPIIEMEH